MTYVAGQIETSRRRENFLFSHHREVAPLEPRGQGAMSSIVKTAIVSVLLRLDPSVETSRRLSGLIRSVWPGFYSA